MKQWFDQKFTAKMEIIFKESDLVLFNISSQVKETVKPERLWIGPCKVIYKQLGHLYDLKYMKDKRPQRFFRVHPEFIKLYCGQVS